MEVRRLDAERKRLAQELGILRSALATLESGAVDEPAEVAQPEPDPEKVPVGADRGPTAVEAGKDRSVANVADENDEPVEVSTATDDQEAVAAASAPAETVVAGGDIFALQLIGFFNRESLDEFVNREELPKKVYSARQTYRGRPWYVLIHSLHDDYDAAEVELSRLPADLVALEPWIRPLSQVTELKIIETRKGAE